MRHTISCPPSRVIWKGKVIVMVSLNDQVIQNKNKKKRKRERRRWLSVLKICLQYSTNKDDYEKGKEKITEKGNSLLVCWNKEPPSNQRSLCCHTVLCVSIKTTISAFLFKILEHSAQNIHSSLLSVLDHQDPPSWISNTAIKNTGIK